MAESQRWRLLGAACEVLAEQGYAKTRSADIARHAGVSRSTFYEQFRDVDDCLLAAFAMAADCIADLVSEACEEGRYDDSQLQRTVQSVLDFLADDPALTALFGPEAAAGVPGIAAAREQLAAGIGKMLRRTTGRASGPGPAELERSMIVGGLATIAELISAGESHPRGLACDVSRLLARRFPPTAGGSGCR